ncbi:MAG: hypothetical protein N2201_06180, partial [candidate division WOR-3 bacterium]|nr:hypothetical protein [candidate division WOR-3 bacterium]
MRKTLSLFISLFLIVIAEERNFSPTQIKVAFPDSLLYTMSVAGYTTYDWPYGGPTWTWSRVDSIANGVHAICMRSNELSSPWSDRNMGYNFYSFLTHSWIFGDLSNVFTQRSGFGSLDYDPVAGVAVVSAHQSIGGRLTPIVGKDLASGTGNFIYCLGPTGFLWPVVAVTQNQTIHCAMIKEDPIGDYDDTLYYSRIQPWCTWSTPIRICPPMPEPYGPCQNIHASKSSNKIIITWTQWEHPGSLAAPVDSAYYIISNDGGLTWQTPVLMPFPPAFQGIPYAKPSYHITSLYAMFDRFDNLHIIAAFNAVLYDTFPVVIPAEIWHYCPTNNPVWSFVRRADTDTLIAGGGFNYLWACRPSLVQQSTTGYLYAVWEEFDSIPNVDPTTGYNRADIWVAESRDNGLTWPVVRRVTTPNTTSKRYPCAAGVAYDTLYVTFMIDSVAGSVVMTQGRATRNPIAMLHIPVPFAPGIEAQPRTKRFSPLTLKAPIPNPFKTLTTIHYSLPGQVNVSLQIYDISGRLVKTLIS